MRENVKDRKFIKICDESKNVYYYKDGNNTVDVKSPIIILFVILTQSRQSNLQSKADDLIFIKITVSNHPQRRSNIELYFKNKRCYSM